MFSGMQTASSLDLLYEIGQYYYKKTTSENLKEFLSLAYIFYIFICRYRLTDNYCVTEILLGYIAV